MRRFLRWARPCLLYLGVGLGSALSLAPVLHVGWVAGDDGLLAEVAERVAQGELPQRDFDDAYSGGLAMLDAATFRALGTRLISLRITLLIAFALWTMAMFAIARRFTSTAGALLVVALAVAWNVLVLPNPGVSWFLIYLFVGGAAALCNYIERRRPVWLVLAGVAGGAAIAIKVVGLFYVAAALLLFVFLEQQGDAPDAPADDGNGVRDRTYSLIVSALLLVFVGVLLRLVERVTGVFGPPLHFVLPSALLVAVLLWREWRRPARHSLLPRVRRLLAMILPFLVGAALPLTLFVLPYVASGSVPALINGLFVLPQKRFEYAWKPPSSLRTIAWGIPWLLLFAVPARWWRGRVAVVTVVLVALTIPMAIWGGMPYRSLWRTFDHLDWVVAAVGTWLIVSTDRERRLTPVKHAQLWMLLCIAALGALVRFPIAGATYLLVYMPLLALAGLAIVTVRPGGAGPVPTIAAALLLVVGIACVDARRFSLWGTSLPPMGELVPLGLSRGGISVSREDSAVYGRTVGLLQSHSAANAYIYAGPDLPQVYFLSARRNPTRTLYDFFDDSSTHDASVLRAIDSHAVTVVAINIGLMYSHPMDAALRAALRLRFPDSAIAGTFVVRWRDSSRQDAR